MNRPILRFGALSAAILVGVNVITLLLLGVPDAESYGVGEIIGYATIIVSLIPIVFALEYYRDREGDGRLGFWRGVGIGAGVAALPSVVFAIYNLIYVRWIDPDFSENYLQYATDRARESMTSDEFHQYAAQLEAQQSMLSDPLFQMGIMFLTVFLLGLLISVISALVLQRKTARADSGT